MFLFLDSATGSETIVALLDRRYSVLSIRQRRNMHRSSRVLLVDIFSLLQKAKKTLRDIQGIIVIHGEGKFTALRMSVILANTLAWALHIPLFGVITSEQRPRVQTAFREFIRFHAQRARRPHRRQSFLLPHYGKEPNITRSTKHGTRHT